MIAPGTWALVELMGHRQVVGTLSETEVAGTKLLVVDPVNGPRQLYSGHAIYAITPCTEEQARAKWPWLFEQATAELAPVESFDEFVDDDYDDEVA